MNRPLSSSSIHEKSIFYKEKSSISFMELALDIVPPAFVASAKQYDDI